MMMTTKETIKRAREAKEYICQLRKVFSSLSRGEKAFVDECDELIRQDDDAAIIRYVELRYLKELLRGTM